MPVLRLAVLDQNLSDATIVITTPFHPAYMTRERMDAAPALKLILTAGIGSDHVDLRAAMEKGITVAEVTGEHYETSVRTNVNVLVMGHLCKAMMQQCHVQHMRALFILLTCRGLFQELDDSSPWSGLL